MVLTTPSHPREATQSFEYRTVPTESLSPLTCPECGNPVPLADGTHTVCPSCRREVMIPHELRDLRLARAEEALKDRAPTAAAWTRLAAPPTLRERLASMWARGILLLLLLVLICSLISGAVSFFTGYELDALDVHAAARGVMAEACDHVFTMIPNAWGWTLHSLAPRLGTDYADVGNEGRCYAVQAALLLVGLVLPSLFFDDIIRRRHARDGTLASLRARRHRDAPVWLCRTCGGALEDGASKGARCVYCRADNLLEAAGRPVSPAPACVTAIEADQQETARLLATPTLMRRYAGRAFLLIPLFWLAGFVTESCVQEEFISPPAFEVTGRLVSRNHDPLSPNTQAEVRFLPSDRMKKGRAAAYFIALKRGQHLLLLEGSPDLRVAVQRRQPSPWYQLDWRWHTDSDSNDFVAPYTGWFRLVLFQPAQVKETPVWIVWSRA